MELLQIIRDRKLVRRDHLEIISPSYRNTGKNRTLILNKSIRKMFELHCIDKIHVKKPVGEGGNNPCIVSLDRGGSLLLGIPHRPRIIQTNKDSYLMRSLPSNYKHINGINQIEVDTILFCEDTGSEILEWVHEKPQKLVFGAETVNLIPDIRMALKINQKPFCAFLEYDTGSESKREKEPKIIVEKIKKYRKYKISKLWQEEYKSFPVIFLVTEDLKRVDFFTRECEERGLLGFGIYHKDWREALERLTDIV